MNWTEVKQKWNARFSEEGYAYGTAPNRFFKEILNRYQLSGKMLLPAEGEGRNAVYAAQHGFKVTAIDISDAGKQKAELLAKAKGVTFAYEVGDIREIALQEETFDVAGLIFAHFPIDIVNECHHMIAKAVKPGGYIIIECFGKGHSELRKENPAIGGPESENRLSSLEEIIEDFSDFEVLLADTPEITLSEGKYHNGSAKVIRFVGKKKSY